MPLRGKSLVMLQFVGGVVRGANDPDLEFFQDALRGQLRRGQLFVGLPPDFFGGLLVEQIGDAEVTFQFEVRPMVERVAQGVRHGCGPGLELVKRAGGAGAKVFRHAVGPHGAPFVMVAFKPDFKKIFEPAVFRDVAWRNVAVIIKNRLGFGVFVVEMPRGFRAQQKIFVDEVHKYSAK